MDFRKLITTAVLLLLFAAGGAHSQLSPLSKTLDSLQVYVPMMAGVPVAGSRLITPALVKFYINMAYNEVCSTWPAVERIDTVFIARGLEGALLPTDFRDMLGVYREGDTTWRAPLTFISHDSVAQVLKTARDVVIQDINNIMVPAFYTIQERRLILHPKYIKEVSQDYIIHYIGMGTTLVNGADTLEVQPIYIPKVYQRAAAYLASMRLDDFLGSFFIRMYEGAAQR